MYSEKIEMVLNHKNWTGLTLRQLIEAQRVGGDPQKAAEEWVNVGLAGVWPAHAPDEHGRHGPDVVELMRNQLNIRRKLTDALADAIGEIYAANR
jgi:hypothetical protein